MQKLLLRRVLRDMKANIFRYLALFLLIVLVMFLIISMVGSAESIIGTVDKKAQKNHLEDGQFGVFVPLDNNTIEKLRDKGVTLEECFYLDFSGEGGSTLRVMKNREQINLVELTKGRLAETKHEIVLERIYAAAHKINIGDSLDIGGSSYTVTGIGTSADYDHCLKNLSDMSSDGQVFGTAFVTAPAYEELLQSEKVLHTQEYRYSYLLTGNITDTGLKDDLSDLKLSPNEINDTFFQEMVNREMGPRNETKDGIQTLADSTNELSNALNTFKDGVGSLENGIQTIYDGLKQLNEQSAPLSAGSDEVFFALKELETNAHALSFSVSSVQELKEASSALLAGTEELNNNLQTLSEQISLENFEADMNSTFAQYGIAPSSLSSDAQVLLGFTQTYLTQVDAGLAAISEGSGELHRNLRTFDEAMSTLPASMEALNLGMDQFHSAIATLLSEYGKLNDGVSAYTEGLHQIYEGYSEISEGAGRLNEGAQKLADNGEEFRGGVVELQDKTDELLEEYFPFETGNLTDFVKAADNPRIKAANGDVEINRSVGKMAGMILLVLITYVISIFVIHSIEQESSIIGALYALGLKQKQLLFHYTMLPVILCFFGGAAGTLLGYSNQGISFMTGESSAYYSIPPIDTVYTPGLLVYGLIIPPLTAFVVNALLIRKKLNQNALSLLRKEQVHKGNSHRQLKAGDFIHMFQIRQFLREKRSCFAVLAGMFISLLVLVLGLNCYALCRNLQAQNVADTKYEYMYQYKYPPETAPRDSYAAYVKSLKKEVMGYDMEISVIGLNGENSFFPPVKSKKQNEISISSSVADKYGLQVGEELMLHDEVNEKVYGFTVKEIINYSPGLCCFMDIGSMRELFGQDSDFYNVVYADHELDIDAGRLYAVSTKADIEKSSSIFLENMMSLIVTMSSAAILIFIIVLYQMMKVMIDRSAVSISLMKIFGYRDKEIQKLYLDGNFLLISIGALIMIPAAKWLMDAIYPVFVANVACGLDLSWTPLMYILTYSGILLSYLLIRTVLLGRLKKATPSEILKNRE